MATAAQTAPRPDRHDMSRGGALPEDAGRRLRRNSQTGRYRQGREQRLRPLLDHREPQADPACRVAARHLRSSWEYGGITILERDEDEDSDADVHRDGPAQAHRPAPHRRPRLHPRRNGAPVRRHPQTAPAKSSTACRGARVSTGSTRVSIELTTQMLAILFDFPWEDRRKLTEWSDWVGDIEVAQKPELKEQRRAVLEEACVYFQKLWMKRSTSRRPPTCMSMMIHTEAMSQMDQYEFIGNLVLLIVGGNDTTRNSMSALAYGLDQFPDQRAKLEADPTLIPNAVSEIIRWQTPLAHMRRTATRRCRTVRAEDRQGRQADPLVHLREPRRERVRRCRHAEARPRKCAPAPVVRIWHSPLRRRPPCRTATAHPARGDGRAADARHAHRRGRTRPRLFRPWFPPDAGSDREILTRA